MNSLKRTCASLALVLLLAVSVAGGVAQAHVSKQNNGISAELHIPPGDSPKAGEPTRIRISFEDKKGSFRLQDCDCKINLEQSGKVLQTSILEPATKGATLDSFSTITFPRVGVYDIVVTGSSKNGAFPSFKLDYQVRVASGA
ncbi:MAG: hypothetical protein JWO35_682, partial [Candidatus Saccharibacteria bacterium]|nr:hypothetical protein [Candidatus Saccharibacteria bacterium]